MTPTAEQLAIIKAAVETKDSLLLNALAGAAKTSTLELICRALPVQPILSLAFNKRIAEEMTKRLPGHVQCRTLNSIGHRVWAQTCTKKLVLNKDKMYTILKEKVDAMPRLSKSEAFDSFSTILKAAKGAKLSGYVPAGKYPNAKRLIENLQAASSATWGWEDEEESNWTWLIDEVLIESIKLAYQGQIDFDDQIYMPTLFGGTFPKFPLILVDEAQDLSALNHAMLAKLVTQRLIAVGDPYQSIYGFRGAIHSGMSKLQTDFSMVSMGLSISFRCPKSIVERARFRAPHMQWPDWAKEGHVTTLDKWSASGLPDSAAIICRNNAPLFYLALRLLRAGRGVQLVGSDLGPGLVRALKKLGPESLTREEVLNAIDSWEAKALEKTKSKGATRDKAECLRVFANFGESLLAAIAYAEGLFQSSGPIQLLSGHKSKGLEWETVYHLDPWRIPSPFAESEEDLEQEQNVKYVIETRAKEALYLVNMEDFDASI